MLCCDSSMNLQLNIKKTRGHYASRHRGKLLYFTGHDAALTSQCTQHTTGMPERSYTFCRFASCVLLLLLLLPAGPLLCPEADVGPGWPVDRGWLLWRCFRLLSCAYKMSTSGSGSKGLWTISRGSDGSRRCGSWMPGGERQRRTRNKKQGMAYKGLLTQKAEHTGSTYQWPCPSLYQ